jgi:hypothetical protein
VAKIKCCLLDAKEDYIMANYKKWTSTETDFISSNHKTMCDETLAKELTTMTGQSITTAMVRRQRRKLSLKKDRGRPRKINSSTINVSNIN